MKTEDVEKQKWWASLSSGERRLIWSVMKLLRSAKQSQVGDVASAAAKWESSLGCFMKARLMSSCRERRGDLKFGKQRAELSRIRQ
jgi:hypothetical protein